MKGQKSVFDAADVFKEVGESPSPQRVSGTVGVLRFVLYGGLGLIFIFWMWLGFQIIGVVFFGFVGGILWTIYDRRWRVR